MIHNGQVGWQYRVFETALRRMEEGGLYPIVERKQSAKVFLNGIEWYDQYFLQPEELKQSLYTYFEHFQQKPKNAEAYVSFLSKHLCFGSDWWPIDENGEPLPRNCVRCGQPGEILNPEPKCNLHWEDYSVMEGEHNNDRRKPTLWTKGLKPPLKEYLLQKVADPYFYFLDYSIKRKIWKLALSYGVVNRKTLPSISEIISDVDKVLTVVMISEYFYEFEYMEDEERCIAPEQEVITRYEREKDYY